MADPARPGDVGRPQRRARGIGMPSVLRARVTLSQDHLEARWRAQGAV